MLVDFHRAGGLVDRYPDDPLSLGDGLNYFTGAPESATDLKTHARMRGSKLQREAFFMPMTIATAHLRRPCNACDNCTAERYDRCEFSSAFKYVPTHEWTEQQAADIYELESRIQTIFVRWEAEHLLARRPPVLFTGDLKAEQPWLAQPGQDSWAAFLLPPGIERARAFCVGPPEPPSWVRDALNDNRRSPLWLMDDARRARAPQWQQKEFRDEGGHIYASAPTPADDAQRIATRCPLCSTFHVEGEPCPTGPPRRLDQV